MRRKGLGSVTLLASAVALSSTAGLPAAEFFVDCDQSHHPIYGDSAAIQSLVDGAKRGDVIVVAGNCYLDGGLYVEDQGGPANGAGLYLHRPGMTLAGLRLDDDGDGAFNEDWEDGEDNDGDGWTDEDGWDAVLHGVVLSGEIADDCDHPVYAEEGRECDRDMGPFADHFYNRGVTIAASQVTVRDLELTSHRTALSASGVVFWEGEYCAGIEVLPQVRGDVVERNHFVENGRALLSFGEAKGLGVRENLFTDIEGFGVSVTGGLGACVERHPDGDYSRYDFDYGESSHLTVRDNRLLDVNSDGLFGIAAVGADHVTVKRNSVIGSSEAGILVWDAEHATVQQNTVAGSALAGIVVTDGGHLTLNHNEIHGSLVGIYGQLSATGANVLGNKITALCVGVVLDFYANGYKISGNELDDSMVYPPLCGFVGLPAVDILLTDTTFDNLVVLTGPEDTVLDLGDNTVVGRD